MKNKKTLMTLILLSTCIYYMIVGGKSMYKHGYDPNNKPSLLAQSAMMGW